MSRALGRYELLRPLARGGMAEVYLARRRAAGVEKVLVVKRIRAERATDVQFLDLFVREARLSMSLAHQNIVPVFDFGRIDDQVFLAMERVEGRDLGSSLARAAARTSPLALSPLLAAFIAAECCQALDYAHRRKSPEGIALGIVHRDVTPRNVLLSWSGEVKLTDFGIAALAGDSTTALLGTPAYMAPEQARREPLDARTDVYAVGLVLREMLTGQRARPGADRDSLVGAARTGTLAPWPAHSLPAALVAIVDRASALAVRDRYADARALLEALDEFIVGERAAKKVESPARQLAAWLDIVWGAVRDDDAGISGEIVADHMVSFLDDGALDVVGTGTQRSLLATAAEPAEPGAGSPVDAHGTTGIDVLGATGVASLAGVNPRAAGVDVLAVTAPIPAPPPVPTAAPSRARTLIAGGATTIVAILAIAWLTRERDDATAPRDAAVAIAVVDAAPREDATAATPDMLVDAGAIVDAAIVVPPRDASPIVPPRDASPRSAPSDASMRVRVDAPVATEPAARRVRINAKPWAFLTVDGVVENRETPVTLTLAPGRYVLHFANPELKITRDVTIDVPTDRDIQHIETLAP